jgi:hypothetical protein
MTHELRVSVIKHKFGRIGLSLKVLMFGTFPSVERLFEFCFLPKKKGKEGAVAHFTPVIGTMFSNLLYLRLYKFLHGMYRVRL